MALVGFSVRNTGYLDIGKGLFSAFSFSFQHKLVFFNEVKACHVNWLF